MEDKDAPKRFHDDDAVNSLLNVLNDKASFYRLACGILTGKFDDNFAGWKMKTASTINHELTADLPDVEPIVEWMFTNATTNDLFLFQDVLNDLMAKLLSEMFGRYAEKDVRGMLPEGFGLLELSECRKDLVNVLNGTLTMAKNGMLPAIMAEPATLEALPAVKKRKRFGETGWVWDFPDAPNPEKTANGPVTVVPGTNNFRAHNTTVKFVINGEIPSDHPEKLGEAVDKYFPGKSTQDVGRLFENWHTNYCGDGTTEPAKVLARDDRKVYFTIVG